MSRCLPYTVAIVAALAACKQEAPRPPPSSSSIAVTAPVPVTAPRADAATAPTGNNVVRGRLRLDGQPFADRTLALCASGDVGVSDGKICKVRPPIGRTRTDAEGDFVFAGVPDGEYTVLILEPPHHVFTMPWGEVRGGVTVARDMAVPATTPAEIDHRDRNTLRGRLVHHGQPLAHVALELCTAHGWNREHATPCWRGPHRVSTRTDSNGNFVFAHVADGDVQIVVLELPYYPHILLERGLHGGITRDLGDRRVHATDELPSPDYDDRWP